MDLQKIVDAMAKQSEMERAESQMTLGELISRLKELGETEVDGFENPDSYRGYYSDLAFVPTGKKAKASELLAIAQECLGKEFTGYKGGEYTMTKVTPVWLGFYGTTQDSKKIISISDDGSILAEEEEF
jgi:hypothetical protein